MKCWACYQNHKTAANISRVIIDVICKSEMFVTEELGDLPRIIQIVARSAHGPVFLLLWSSAFLRQAGDQTQCAVIKYVANFDLLSHKKSIKEKLQNLEKEVSLLVVSMIPV